MVNDNGNKFIAIHLGRLWEGCDLSVLTGTEEELSSDLNFR